MDTYSFGCERRDLKAEKPINPSKSMISFKEQSPPKSQINIFISPHNPKTNSLKMPEFQTKICDFVLYFIALSMREMGCGEVREYGQKKTPTREEWGIYHSIFEPLFLLHLQHNVCKFSSVVKPPFDKGIIWSISKSK